MKKRIINISTIFAIIIALLCNINNCYATSNEINDTKKSNNYLQTLQVENYEITPEFNKNTTTYYVVVPTSTSSITVNATAEVEEATVKVTGNESLTKTENTVKVTVTSQSKLTKTYNIIVTKQADNGLSLSELQIEGATFEKELTSGQYTYKASIKEPDEKSDLKINAKANKSNATVEIIGDKQVEQGDNLVTIILKEGSNITTYQITVSVTVEKTIVSSIENVTGISKITNSIGEFFGDENKRMAFLIAVAVVLFIIVVNLIIRANKRSKTRKSKQNLKKRAK